MSPRHSAEDRFAALLDGSTAAMDPSLAPMLSLAGALRLTGAGVGPAGPDPAFRAALRQRLVAVATVTALEPTVATPGFAARPLATVRARTQRRFAALTAAVALSTSMAGVGFAASMSLPGDPFYNVKRATESVQLWTAQGNLAKGQRNLEFARTRLAEAQQLSPTSPHLAPTLATMNAETTTAAGELLASYHSSRSTKPLDDLTSFTHQQYAGLVQLAATLPPAARAPEQAATAVLGRVLHQVDTATGGTCTQCGPLHGLTGQLGGVGGTGTPGGIGGTAPGTHPGGSASTTKPAPGASPGSGSGPGASPGPSGSPSTGPSPQPTPTPTSILPLPSLSPLPLPTLLPLPSSSPHHHHTHPKPLLSPIPIVSTLLGGLGL